ncbi:MAG: flagellar basal body P-ring formation chaperone FlgA [Pseudomonadota bacterium]
MRSALSTFAALLMLVGSDIAAAAEGTLVAARMLPLGTVLSIDDVAVSKDIKTGALMKSADAIGRETRRTIFAGRPILRGDLRDVSLVRRNDIIELRYAQGNLTIRTDGRALDRGSAGETVSVMNLDSRLVVRGIVSGPGRVEVAQ